MSGTAIEVDVDLDLLLDSDGLRCTSRTRHRCTTEVVARATATTPCPDAAVSVFWCSGRLALHDARLMADVTCAFCGRPCLTCWRVVPI